MSTILRIKLSAMMFFQFMILAVFFPQLAAYLGNIKADNVMVATIMVTMAWGALLSPIIGMLADRFVNGEKLLFALNCATAIFLFLAGSTQSHMLLFVCLLGAMLAYMPTWSLTSSIAISNSTPEAFPMIRVFGSIGWVCAAGFALFGKIVFGTSIDGTHIPLFCGAGVSVAAALLALTIPATPPAAKGEPVSLIDVLGLRAFSLLKDFNTAVFMLCACVWMLAFVIYWLFFSKFLSEALNISDITVTMSIGQISEMLFIALLPFAIKLFGLKNTMALGIFAMLLRYLMCAFSSDLYGLHIGAIAVHGIIFGFFFVSAQMYMAKIAPESLQSQAQGLFFFLAFGVSQIIGGYFTGWLIDANIPQNAAAATPSELASAWKNIFFIESAITGLLLVFFMLFFRDATKENFNKA